MKQLITLLGLSFILSACGEQFQGKFIGLAEVTSDTCLNQGGNFYDVSVNATVTGNSVTLKVLTMSPVSGGSSQFTQFFTSVNPLKTSMQSDTFFSGQLTLQDQSALTEGPASYAQATGDINTSRDEISSFTYRVVKQNVQGAVDGGACTFEISANKLVLPQ